MADNDRNPVQQPGSERPEPVVTDPQTIQELLIELTDLNWEKDVEKEHEAGCGYVLFSFPCILSPDGTIFPELCRGI